MLCELRERAVRDGTDQTHLASALLDYTIHRRDELDRADHPDYSSVHTGTAPHRRTQPRRHRDRVLRSAPRRIPAVINNLIAQVVELTNFSAEQDVRNDLREFVRRQPTPARL